MIDINAYFAEVRETADSIQPYSDGGIYLMSLTNKQRGTVAGRISVLANKTVAATHIVNACHRPATAEEIENWKQEQREKAQLERDQQVAKQLRYNLVINAPAGWRSGDPMPVDLAAAVPTPVGGPAPSIPVPAKRQHASEQPKAA